MSLPPNANKTILACYFINPGSRFPLVYSMLNDSNEVKLDITKYGRVKEQHVFWCSESFHQLPNVKTNMSVTISTNVYGYSPAMSAGIQVYIKLSEYNSHLSMSLCM